MNLQLSVSILCIVVLASCGQPATNQSTDRQYCKARKLTLIYDGERVGTQIFPTAIYLEDVYNSRMQFTPHDPVSVKQSGFSVQPAWSPGADWLLLPDGRFDGFVVFNANDLPAGLAKSLNARRIGVCDATGTRWWHEFVSWKSNSIFEFRAGLSGQLFTFKCDLSTGKVAIQDKTLIDFTQLPR
jgi:hypothetical protein